LGTMVSVDDVNNFRVGGIFIFTLATLGFTLAATVFRVQRKRIQCILAAPICAALLVYYVFAKCDATTILRTGDSKYAEQGLWLALIVFGLFDTFSVSIMTALSKTQGIAAAGVASSVGYYMFLAARCDIPDARWSLFSLGIILLAIWVFHQFFHSRARGHVNVDENGAVLQDNLSHTPFEMFMTWFFVAWTAAVFAVASIGLAAGPAGKGTIGAADAEVPYFVSTLMILGGSVLKVAFDRDYSLPSNQ